MRKKKKKVAIRRISSGRYTTRDLSKCVQTDQVHPKRDVKQQLECFEEEEEADRKNSSDYQDCFGVVAAVGVAAFESLSRSNGVARRGR